VAIAHPGANAIVDRLQARRCTSVHHVSVGGTLGLVLLAKQRGVVPAARPTLLTLRQAGMYLSDATLARAPAMVGE
jgi:predicted nucleic acid-binding protein